MIRTLLRLLGFLVLAAGFVALVLDGVRFIATGHWAFLRLGEGIAALSPAFLASIETSVTRNVHPLLWSYALGPLFDAPTAAALGALGVVLLWIGRKPAELIGFAPRR